MQVWRAIRLLGVSSYDIQWLMRLVTGVPLTERAASSTPGTLWRCSFLVGWGVAMTARSIATTRGAGCVVGECFGTVVGESFTRAVSPAVTSGGGVADVRATGGAPDVGCGALGTAGRAAVGILRAQRAGSTIGGRRPCNSIDLACWCKCAAEAGSRACFSRRLGLEHWVDENRCGLCVVERC